MKIVEVKNISKKYIIDRNVQLKYSSLRDKLSELFRHSFSSLKEKKKEEFYALKKISFEVKKGDVVGIIGANGAGKSTILKLLSRVIYPTSGEMIVKGSISSVLEVGTGFHPELTGKENIYLNGVILGMSKIEIKQKIDSIIEFSGIKKFLNTPVKFYSSGMYTRLAFSVAVHMDSDILLIDEILAVGDIDFRKKSTEKMLSMTKDKSRTILFVSHDIGAIKNLCNRCILLEKGRIKKIGSTDEVIQFYMRERRGEFLDRIDYKKTGELLGNDNIKLLAVEFKNDSQKSVITTDSQFKILFKYYNYKADILFNLSMHLFSITGEMIFNSISTPERIGKGEYIAECVIPANLLNDGSYYIDIYFVGDYSNVLYKKNDIIRFNVVDGKRSTKWLGKIEGAVRPKLNWSLYKA